MMKPWQNPLNKAPSQRGKEGREREKTTLSQKSNMVSINVMHTSIIC